MPFVNLMDHPVFGLKPSGVVARIACATISTQLDGIDIIEPIYGPPVGLPEPAPGVYYITSWLVAMSVWLISDREDVFYPDTSRKAHSPRLRRFPKKLPKKLPEETQP